MSKTYICDVIEIQYVQRRYTVEAENKEDAIECLFEGDTVFEEGGEVLSVLDRHPLLETLHDLS
jgi:N-methylhydantoinase A/oxoprolinase/acetone carboxylase beta subunit